MDVMEMDMVQPMAMRMEDRADFGMARAAGGAQMQAQMARAGAVPMEKAMIAPAAAPAPPGCSFLSSSSSADCSNIDCSTTD